MVAPMECSMSTINTGYETILYIHAMNESGTVFFFFKCMLGHYTTRKMFKSILSVSNIGELILAFLFGEYLYIVELYIGIPTIKQGMWQ